MTFDTIIRGGTVATASDTFACDVGIRDGKIAALGADLGSAAEIVDAAGLLAFGRNYPKAKLLVVATDAVPSFKRNYGKQAVEFLRLDEAVARLLKRNEA